MSKISRNLCIALAASATLAGCAFGPAPPLRPAPVPPRDDRVGYLTPRYEENVSSYATLYGRVAVGYTRTAEQACREASCGLDTEKVRHSNQRTRSYLGVRGTETLSGGWAAHFRLESTLWPADGGTSKDSGELKPDQHRGVSFDGGSTVGLSEREFGRIDLGRRDQPAWRIALAADPWADSSVGSPGSRLYLPAGGTRTPGSITYGWNALQEWLVEVQAGHRWCNGNISSVEPGAQPMPARSGCEPAREFGAGVRYARGPWFAGLGWQRWGDSSYAVPVAVNYDAGGFKLYAGATKGRSPVVSDPQAPEGAPITAYTSVFVGATVPVMDKGDPLRQQWTVGLSSFNPAGLPGDLKFGLGWRYRFSQRTSFHIDAAVVRSSGGARREGLEIGFVHAFGRDLRYPL